MRSGVRLVRHRPGILSFRGFDHWGGGWHSFSDADERTKQKVALISETLLRRKFGSDPAVVGRQIRLDSDSLAG
jgi:hypothetical protein